MVERESDIRITTDTPYLALTGELWGVFCEDFGENWPRYNGIALYTDIGMIILVASYCDKLDWFVWIMNESIFSGLTDIDHEINTAIVSFKQVVKCNDRRIRKSQDYVCGI